MKLLFLVISFMMVFSLGIYESKNRSVKIAQQVKATQQTTANAAKPRLTEAEDAMQTLESIKIFEDSEIAENFDLKTAIETLNVDINEEPEINHNTADAGEMIITGG